MSRDHFWRSISRDTNVEVSALSPLDKYQLCKQIIKFRVKNSKSAYFMPYTLVLFNKTCIPDNKNLLLVLGQFSDKIFAH